MTIQFFVPFLPKSIITSNRTSKSAEGARGKWAERAELQAQTHLALNAKFMPDIPRFDCISIALTYCRTSKRPGDGLYRPRDVPNIGGDILKAVCDAIKDAGVIADDDEEHLRAVALGLDRVDDLSQEGILVTIQELVG